MIIYVQMKIIQYFPVRVEGFHRYADLQECTWSLSPASKCAIHPHLYVG